MTSPLSEDPVGPVIVRILAGAATPADEAELRRWLAAEPSRERQLDELRAVWREAGAVHQGWDTAAVQQRILGALDTKPDPKLGTKVVRLRAGRRFPRFESRTPLLTARTRWWLPAAAAAAVLLVLAGALTWRLGAWASRVAPAVPDEPALTELATRRGQRAVLQLSDGTRITLGVDSRLRYPEAFARGASRDVYLDGEAYFEVTRDTARPFRVHAGDAVTRVLGTRFGVRAYAEDRGVRVVVAEGKVALAGRGGATAADVVLGRGDLGELKIGAPPVVRHGADVASHLAWVDGRLVFADTPLSEVVQRLSRWYDLDVRLGDRSLADVPYTMSLRGGESPESVLKVLAAAVGGRLEQHGTAYVIFSRTEVR